MSACKTLVRTSLCTITSSRRTISLLHSPSFRFSPLFSPNQVNLGIRLAPYNVPSRSHASISAEAAADFTEEAHSTTTNSTPEPPPPPENQTQDTVEHLLTHRDDIARLMKMERRPLLLTEPECVQRQRGGRRWFPYLDKFDCGSGYLSSGEVLEALDPYIMDVRKEKFRNVVRNRSYSVCLVVEGLGDFGNVSAAFRSADALGFQSVHVVSCDSSKRYRDNRHVSMGAEKWLDIELWNSAQECFEVLKSRGYRIATTHVGMEAVSVYDMDWSCPTAIVVGNENRGISDEALELSDMHCSIPMKGMVDSFNVSVAAGILMHHAVCDRTSRLGCHGDLTIEESQILLAEFSLRHRKSSISIAQEYAKRKAAILTPRL